MLSTHPPDIVTPQGGYHLRQIPDTISAPLWILPFTLDKEPYDQYRV
jgi:hypothetical protein